MQGGRGKAQLRQLAQVTYVGSLGYMVMCRWVESGGMSITGCMMVGTVGGCYNAQQHVQDYNNYIVWIVVVWASQIALCYSNLTAGW